MLRTSLVPQRPFGAVGQTRTPPSQAGNSGSIPSSVSRGFNVSSNTVRFVAWSGSLVRGGPSRFAGLEPAARRAVAIVARHLRDGSIPDAAVGLDGDLDDVRSAAPQAVAALSAALAGDWPRARLLVQSELGVSTQVPYPWGVIYPVLSADAGRPMVLLDWLVRLVSERVDDHDLNGWVALQLVRRGQLRRGVEIAEQSPLAYSGEWLTALVPAAADVSRPDLVRTWLLEWALLNREPMGTDEGDVAVVQIATAFLPAAAAATFVGLVCSRLPPVGRTSSAITGWLFDLAEVAEHGPSAFDVVVACAGAQAGEGVTLEMARSARTLVASSIRPIFGALLNEEIWRRLGGIDEAFMAMRLWSRNGANRPARAFALLVEVLERSDRDSFLSWSDDACRHASSIVEEVLEACNDVKGAEWVIVRCREVGITLPGNHDPSWFVTRVPLSVRRDVHARDQITKLLRSGDVGEAHQLAIESTFTDMLGPAPASLLVDALIEGGAHGAAFQLASELVRRHPRDAVAGLKLASVLVWLGRQPAAEELTRDALTWPWRSTVGRRRSCWSGHRMWTRLRRLTLVRWRSGMRRSGPKATTWRGCVTPSLRR